VLNPPSPGSRILPLPFKNCGRCVCPTTNSSATLAKSPFSKALSLVDYEEGEVLCPHCGSQEVEQRWSAFSVFTSKKSA
jgi:hypothetical protein